VPIDATTDLSAISDKAPPYAVDAPGTITRALLGRRLSEYPAMTRFRAKVHGA